VNLSNVGYPVEAILFILKDTLLIYLAFLSTASLHETINLFKKWTIDRPSCFAPKERSALK
jgi:hypothetical protein